MSTTRSIRLPNYITARSAQALRVAMFQKNAELGAEVQYFDIQSYTEKGKTKWIAWFFEDLKQTDELINGSAKID